MKCMNLGAVEEGHPMTRCSPSCQRTRNQDRETDTGRLVRKPDMKARVTGISKALWKHIRKSNCTICGIKQDFIDNLANELGFEE